MKNYFNILIVLLFCFAPLSLPAQFSRDSLAGHEDIKPMPQSDSLDNVPPNQIQQSQIQQSQIQNNESVSGKFQMHKSPMGAVWRSFIIPGLGQVYVESYWKAPLFFGAAVGLVGLIIYNNNLYQDFAGQVDNLAEPSDNQLRILKSQREFYRDQRDMSAFYLLGVYVLSAVDAYVGAHLYDFNVDDNISARIAPSRNSFVAISINYHF